MSAVEVLNRSTAIYSKYERYVVHKDEARPEGGDAFSPAHSDVLVKVNALLQKADEARGAADRAQRAALNAEVRRAKASLLEVDMPALVKMAKKGKALTPDKVEARLAKVDAARALVAGVPDGVHVPLPGGLPDAMTAGKGKVPGMPLNPAKLDSRMGTDGYYAQSEAATHFRKEFEEAKVRQDKVLDDVERGVGELKDIGQAMGEALEQQYVLTAALEDKVNEASKDIKKQTARAKGMLLDLKSSRNFCIDATLICILLALGMYIYDLVRKK